MKDYYGILGVAKTATADQIKKAYRRLAKENHPDLHPGDRQAEARFKEINEAYSVLGEESARGRYDADCAAEARKKQAAEAPRRPQASRAPVNPNFDISNMAQSMGRGFESFFGFNPETGEITNEEMLSGSGSKKKQNPLDMSQMFERFMGFK